ncbi:MAG TPA: hypothetical protein VLA76_08125 [Candidatus Angelobacter sp.]|nr:hypothetical protein [Candidatus Angelobacter sp.]
MTRRQLPAPITGPEDGERPDLRHSHTRPTGIAEHRSARPQSHEEADERYVAARDAWTAAMRKASSGTAADLAALAIAQEAYEAALAEKERWSAVPRVAIPVEPDPSTGIEAVVGQELSWRRVHEHERAEDRPKGLRGLVRRLRGR